MMLTLAKNKKASFYITYEIKRIESEGNNDFIMVTGYGVDLGGNKEAKFGRIKIPNEIEGLTVKMLENCCSEPLEYIPYKCLSQGDEKEYQYSVEVKELVIPDSVFHIKSKAFSHSRQILSVVWPAGCSNIPCKCFEYSSIENLTIPEGIKRIRNQAFASSNLKTINLPNSCLRLGSLSFKDCSNLKSITLPASILRIGDYAFSSSGLEEVTWPENCKIVSPGCFSNCCNLKKITIKGNTNILEEGSICSAENLEVLDMSLVISPKLIFSPDVAEKIKSIPKVIPPFYTDMFIKNQSPFSL